ncbi:MAG TPA: transposase [Nitrospiraceae bacterium]|nr:transposase [Nitrospiraceae bacterium]
MATVTALREVCRSERTALEGIAAYGTSRNKVNLCFAEGLNNKIRMIQRYAYGYRMRRIADSRF